MISFLDKCIRCCLESIDTTMKVLVYLKENFNAPMSPNMLKYVGSYIGSSKKHDGNILLSTTNKTLRTY